MPTAIIRSGICGFTVRATADCEDSAHVALQIESDCPNYRKIAEALHEVDAFHELFGDRSEGQIWKVCAATALTPVVLSLSGSSSWSRWRRA